MKLDPDNLRRLARRLEGMYGGKAETMLGSVGRDPVDVLVATILSQATSDVNSKRAFKNLKDRFGSWEAVADAPDHEVARAISVGGLARQKAPRIKRILKDLRSKNGLSLDFLRDESPDSAFRYLVGLQGVGPKTAACVMLFGLNRPCFPVDTHILRLSERLGLVPAGTGAAKAQEIMGKSLPPECIYPLHIYMIQHGRKVCRAKNPRCHVCELEADCDYARSRTDQVRA